MDECEVKRKKIGVFFKKHRYMLVAGSILVTLPLLWFLWGTMGAKWFLEFACSKDCDLNKLGPLGDLFGGVNALFAALALAAVAIGTDLTRRAVSEERQWSRDEKYVEQVIKSYEWAYHVLTDNESSTVPQQDRLKWLTCARHLSRAKLISSQVVGQEFKTILEEHEEYWRTKFYISMNSDELKKKDYFSGVTFPYSEEEQQIDLRSAMIIFKFSSWPEGRTDPLDAYSYEDLRQQLPGYAARGFGEYFAQRIAQAQAGNKQT